MKKDKTLEEMFGSGVPDEVIKKMKDILEAKEESKMSDVKEMAHEELVRKLRERATAGGKAKPEKKEKPKAPEKAFTDVPVMEMGEHTKMFSEVFGFTPSWGTDFPVPYYGEYEWTDEDKDFIPSEDKFATFVVPKEVLEAEMLALKNNQKVLVVGPTGSGKTSLQEYICAKIKQPYYRINGRQDMESDTLIGKPWVTEGKMEYVMGELPKAMLAGWFVAFDEPWKTPSGIQMALQRMYERGGILQLDDMPGALGDKQVKPHDNFNMVLCDNVVGTGDNVDKYGATMIQDGSTLNRMDVVLRLNYLNQDDEVGMLMGMHPAITKGYATKMVQLFNLLRINYEEGDLSVAASPRNLDAWGQLAVDMQDYRKAFEVVMLQRYADDTERSAVEDHYRNVFGA